MKTNIKNTAFHYTLFIIGLFIASMGVAFSTKAGLGTSPVSSVPYSVSLLSKLLTFGGWLNLLSVIQITVQVILLRSKCNPVEIVIQTILAFVYGYLTNLSCGKFASHGYVADEHFRQEFPQIIPPSTFPLLRLQNHLTDRTDRKM